MNNVNPFVFFILAAFFFPQRKVSHIFSNVRVTLSYNTPSNVAYNWALFYGESGIRFRLG